MGAKSSSDRAARRAARARQESTGEPYTVARREVVEQRVDQDAVAVDTAAVRTMPWTWTEAADRLDAMHAVLGQAVEVLDLAAKMQETWARLPQAPRGALRSLVHAANGDFPTFSMARAGLTGAINRVKVVELDQLRHERDFHSVWYVQQAWQLVAAAADGEGPVQLPPVLTRDAFDWQAPDWEPPADVYEVIRRLEPGWLVDSIRLAVADMRYAMSASSELEAWEESKMLHHDCDDADDDFGDRGCTHQAGPAEHEIDQWNRLEEEASGFLPARDAFCEAVRVWARARADAGAGGQVNAGAGAAGVS